MEKTKLTIKISELKYLGNSCYSFILLGLHCYKCDGHSSIIDLGNYVKIQGQALRVTYITRFVQYKHEVFASSLNIFPAPLNCERKIQEAELCINYDLNKDWLSAKEETVEESLQYKIKSLESELRDTEKRMQLYQWAMIATVFLILLLGVIVYTL
jgi:hypothetical protein